MDRQSAEVNLFRLDLHFSQRLPDCRAHKGSGVDWFWTAVVSYTQVLRVEMK